jgi:hypothetical protein
MLLGAAPPPVLYQLHDLHQRRLLAPLLGERFRVYGAGFCIEGLVRVQSLGFELVAKDFAFCWRDSIVLDSMLG